MGTANGYELGEKIGLVPVLRAGLGMVEGVWEMMPSAEVWHIGLFRDERTLKPIAYYNRLPDQPHRRYLPRARSDAGDGRLGFGHGGYSEEVGREEDQIHGAARRARGHCQAHQRSS